jgi:hypothetical protein
MNWQTTSEKSPAPEVTAGIRKAIYLCCMATAIFSGTATVTIAVALFANTLQDPQAWMSMVFFLVAGFAAWTSLSRGAYIKPSDA